MSTATSKAAPSADAQGQRANADLQAQYNDYKGQMAQLSQKIGELEGDLDEHR